MSCGSSPLTPTTTWPLPPLTAPPAASRVSLAAVLPSPFAFAFAAACVRPDPASRIIQVEQGAARSMSSASSAEGEATGEFTEVVIVRHGETSWNASRIIQVALPFSSLISLLVGTRQPLGLYCLLK
jgi:hypothetical protein